MAKKKGEPQPQDPRITHPKGSRVVPSPDYLLTCDRHWFEENKDRAGVVVGYSRMFFGLTGERRYIRILFDGYKSSSAPLNSSDWVLENPDTRAARSAAIKKRIAKEVMFRAVLLTEDIDEAELSIADLLGAADGLNAGACQMVQIGLSMVTAALATAAEGAAE